MPAFDQVRAFARRARQKILPRWKPDWKLILRRAWSVRLAGMAVLLSGLEVAVPFLEGVLELPRGLFAGLSGGVTAAALAARITVQSNMEGDEL